MIPREGSSAARYAGSYGWRPLPPPEGGGWGSFAAYGGLGTDASYSLIQQLRTAPRKKVYGDCERRPVRCEAPRRGDAGRSSRSGNDAHGRSPPQDLDTYSGELP